MAQAHDPNVSDQRFVEDGYGLARDAMEDKIRAEVQGEFAHRLKGASFLNRWRIRRAMHAEIERRIHALAPPDALY